MDVRPLHPDSLAREADAEGGSAYLDESAYCYIGEQLVADALPSDGDEFFERRVVPFEEALAMALDDRVTESVSKMAILAAALRRGGRGRA